MKRYEVVIDTPGCKECGAGETYTVQDKHTDTIIGMGWLHRGSAEDMCNFMNDAYAAGYADGKKGAGA